MLHVAEYVYIKEKETFIAYDINSQYIAVTYNPQVRTTQQV